MDRVLNKTVMEWTEAFTKINGMEPCNRNEIQFLIRQVALTAINEYLEEKQKSLAQELKERG